MPSSPQGRPGARALRAGALLALLVSGCATVTTRDVAAPDAPAPDVPAPGTPWALGVSPSVLPNLGLTATVSRELGETRGGALAAEAEVTEQFLDDTDITDSKNPPAHDWSQIRLGARWALPYDLDRWLTLRGGGVWFRARGKPNIVQDAGDYYGGFVGVGFETRLAPHLVVGPGLATFLVLDQDTHSLHVVPQLTLRILWTP